MRYLVFLFAFLLSSSFAVALEADEEIYSAGSLVIENNISSRVDILYGSSRAQVTELSLFLTLFPKQDYRQQVMSSSVTPEPAQRNTSAMVFTWQDPSDAVQIALDDVIVVENTFIPITTKVPYPITGLDASFLPYIEEAALIDITPEIQQQALSLAAGEDDLYVVVHKVADWVESHISYSLNTVTAEAALPASWVFANRQGVCDELTLLFMAMLRSLDVPVRFTSGFAYTSSLLFDEKWNAHAWAEVYFPGYGWIPFDISYREFGLLDASHIKYLDAVDGNSSLTRYHWAGYDIGSIDIRPDILQFDAEIIESRGSFVHPVVIEAAVSHGHVGYGSYNEVEVTLRNPTDSYLSIPLSVFSSQEVTFLEDKRNVLLAPRQRSVEKFFLKLTENLQDTLEYTIPVHVVTPWHEQITTFKADTYGDVFANAADQEVEQELRDVLICDVPSRVQVGSHFLVECGGEIFCIDQDCGRSINYMLDQQGIHTLVVVGTNASATLSVVAEEFPVIQVADVNHSEQVSYGDDFVVHVDLSVAGTAHVTQVDLVQSGSRISWDLGSISTPQRLIGELSSSFLLPGENVLDVIVVYEDFSGKQYVKVRADFLWNWLVLGLLIVCGSGHCISFSA